MTMSASIYAALSLGLGDGLDYAAQDEKALVIRIVAMYAVVIMVNLISRSERIKRTGGSRTGSRAATATH